MPDHTKLRQLGVVNMVLLCSGVLFAMELHLTTAAASLSLAGHWPSHQRDLVVVDQTGQKAWQDATKWAVARWRSVGADVTLEWSTGSGPCEPEGGRIPVCLASAFELEERAIPGVQGLVDPKIDLSDHTEETVVLVCSDCRIDAARRRVIATHEIGHALGLQHSARRTSVMFHTGGSPSPDSADAEELRAIYAHSDPPPRCGVLNIRLGGVCI